MAAPAPDAGHEPAHRRWFRWSITGVFVAIAMSILVPTYLYGRTAARISGQANRNSQEIIDRQVAACESQNMNRSALRAVLEQVAHPPAGLTIDFRHVDGWDRLDVNTQLYIANLLTSPDATRTNQFLVQVLANYRRSNPIQDCAAVRRQVTRKLNVGG